MSNFRRQSPLNQQHVDATALSRGRVIPTETLTRRLLFGDVRRLVYPRSALTTEREMGDVRHALAQRVVAGVYYVDTPFSTFKAVQPVSPDKSAPKAKR